MWNKWKSWPATIINFLRLKTKSPTWVSLCKLNIRLQAIPFFAGSTYKIYLIQVYNFLGQNLHCNFWNCAENFIVQISSWHQKYGKQIKQILAEISLGIGKIEILLWTAANWVSCRILKVNCLPVFYYFWYL